MVMQTTVIPTNVNYDDETIGLNNLRQLEIKSNGVGSINVWKLLEIKTLSNEVINHIFENLDAYPEYRIEVDLTVFGTDNSIINLNLNSDVALNYGWKNMTGAGLVTGVNKPVIQICDSYIDNLLYGNIEIIGKSESSLCHNTVNTNIGRTHSNTGVSGFWKGAGVQVSEIKLASTLANTYTGTLKLYRRGDLIV